MTPDGASALRREIRIGRQNQEFFELIAGLEAGAQVITSSYDMFGNASRIEFEEPVDAL